MTTHRRSTNPMRIPSCECGAKGRMDYRYDAYFCPVDGTWLEEKCGCETCQKRPEKHELSPYVVLTSVGYNTPHLCLITGRPGSGKSRLVRSLLAEFSNHSRVALVTGVDLLSVIAAYNSSRVDIALADDLRPDNFEKWVAVREVPAHGDASQEAEFSLWG